MAECRTDVANAHRLVELAGSDLRYVPEWKEWIVWDGQRWVRDANGIVVREKAKAVPARLWEEIARSDAPPPMLAQYIAYAKVSSSAHGITNMVDLARGLLAISATRLDASPMLLNVPNGTLDLRTGELRPHDRYDFLTKLCPTPFDPAAPCPTWERFLREVFEGNGELIAYLQRFFGYGLTGDISEQVLPIFWGGGSNGKSTLVNALLAVVGDDHAGSPPQTLFKVSTHGDRHPTELMTLRGRRLMMAQETEAGCKLNEALIKHLTGGDRVTGRGMYENFTTFSPTHKILLGTNYKPEVKGCDYAIWRRLKLIEFRRQFKGSEVDRKLPWKLLAEAQGILAWMVRGCMEWQKGGLMEPKCIADATAKYAREQDVIGQFLNLRCERGNYVTSASDLYRAFMDLFPDSGITQTAFGTDLGRRGFESVMYKSGPLAGRVGRKGLRLT
ncbi:hypothetical protein ETAA1_53080 [Urbifossiella limnaea]|uniref:SF3 helicase domain-containing protein n=2 Tax=Urbifossiella limnaea TaxID=2528023 RepID=A0A517Y0N3_9BACT|nr:hypothetical protein ETAA1_53080 [Urbifossiella limnaea]